MLGKSSNKFSQVVVWWWFTMVQSVKSNLKNNSTTSWDTPTPSGARRLTEHPGPEKTGPTYTIDSAMMWPGMTWLRLCFFGKTLSKNTFRQWQSKLLGGRLRKIITHHFWKAIQVLNPFIGWSCNWSWNLDVCQILEVLQVAILCLLMIKGSYQWMPSIVLLRPLPQFHLGMSLFS